LYGRRTANLVKGKSQMENRRRVSVHLFVCLVLGALILTSAPADAARLNLHRGSRGVYVTMLETRLARLWLLTPTAVDRRYRAATVNSVRTFQRQMGLRATGKVNRRLWNMIAREPTRRARLSDPAIAGHRGAVTGGLAENTLQSLRYAEPYVDVLEFDLHLTADHRLVLMHDTTLDRTTNCSGPVSAWTLQALQEQCLVGDQPIPTFDEVATYAAQEGKAIAPELKDPTMSGADLEEVASVIRDHGLGGRTWLQSVYGSRFAAMRQLVPGLRTVLVSAGAPSVASVRASGATAIASPLTTLTIPRVRDYHRAHLYVWGWTARSIGEIETAKALGCNMVVTDVPRTARARYR
jgi:glycerophosphoryl diester phosphodiesterase